MKLKIPLICPECRRALRFEAAHYLCGDCGRIFPCEGGIAVILPRSIGRFKEEERRYHDLMSERFEEMHGLELERVAVFKEDYLSSLTGLPRGSVVLEVGCGTGWDARRLLGKGIVTYCADISLSMVKRAREYIRESDVSTALEEQGNVRFFVTDAESIPFPDNSFDAVLITAALHHVPSARTCLTEMARVCKPGGLVVLGFEPNAWPYYTVLPVRRLLSIAAKSIGVALRSPREALRKARKVRRAKGAIIELESEDSVPHSPADREAAGFTTGALRRLISEAGLEPVRITPVWYVNGFIQEFGVFKRLRSPSPDIQSILINIDRLFALIPFLRGMNWHWNIIARKPVRAVKYHSSIPS
jgi:ubiquinone/menaquinone biosynthesis C-methylase UbiE